MPAMRCCSPLVTKGRQTLSKRRWPVSCRLYQSRWGTCLRDYAILKDVWFVRTILLKRLPQVCPRYCGGGGELTAAPQCLILMTEKLVNRSSGFTRRSWRRTKESMLVKLCRCAKDLQSDLLEEPA